MAIEIVYGGMNLENSIPYITP